MSLRVNMVVLLCLALLGARVTGLHFHVSAPAAEDHGHSVILAQHHADHDHAPDKEPGLHPQSGASASHLTSDFDASHLDDHAAKHQVDADGDTGLLANLPAVAAPVLFIVFWAAFALAGQLRAGTRLPFQWLRPPPIRRWPTLLLPPSQGPPRAA